MVWHSHLLKKFPQFVVIHTAKGFDVVNKAEVPRHHLHAKMGKIKDRNGMDLTEAEDIKKRWQEYTEELT